MLAEKKLILLKDGDVYGPDAQGKCDVLLGGGRVLAIEPSLDARQLPGEVLVISALGKKVVPGFVDGHQHFTGGGGEGGFHTRTPEMTLSMNIANGVTTAVGLLGTDALTRSVESLYAKTEAFNAEGMTAFMLTGSYWLPSPTITGSVKRDLVYLKPVIGVKLAIADQRGPHMDEHALASLASDVRVAALVANKPGIITVHTGINPDGLDLLFKVIEHYAIRPDIFIPTHVNRKRSKVCDQALELARLGATVDATCLLKEPTSPEDRHLSSADFACLADAEGLFDQVTFSSDAGGSLPKWNEDHSRIVGMGVGTPASLLRELQRLVIDKGLPLAKALRPLTTTPARTYGLAGQKGAIAVGADADLLLLDDKSLEIEDVIAQGRVMVREKNILQKGYFE